MTATAAPITTHPAYRLADVLAVSDIECFGLRDHARSAGVWYDTRHMTDPREWDPSSIDLALLAIDWAVQRGLAERDPAAPHMLRIVRWPS